MPQKIDARAILVAGPLSSLSTPDPLAQAVRGLRQLGVDTVLERAATSARTLDHAQLELDRAIQSLHGRTKHPRPRPEVLVGLEVGGPFVGLRALKDMNLAGAVLIAPPGSVEVPNERQRRVLTDSTVIYDATVAAFAGAWGEASEEARKKIVIMTPEGMSQGTTYLPDARHVSFSPGESVYPSVYGGIEHLLTTYTELRKLADVIKTF